MLHIYYGVGEPALWGNPPYGGNRPQRGLLRAIDGAYKIFIVPL